MCSSFFFSCFPLRRVYAIARRILVLSPSFYKCGDSDPFSFSHVPDNNLVSPFLPLLPTRDGGPDSFLFPPYHEFASILLHLRASPTSSLFSPPFSAPDGSLILFPSLFLPSFQNQRNGCGSSFCCYRFNQDAGFFSFPPPSAESGVSLLLSYFLSVEPFLTLINGFVFSSSLTGKRLCCPLSFFAQLARWRFFC